MVRARVRGVYSTALTKLLLDHGFGIVQPSNTIKERFGLKECIESPDLDITDRRDRQGVQVFGKADSIDVLKSILQSCFDDVITRRWTVALDGIYKGLIKGLDPTNHSVLIDIGLATGRVAGDEVSSPNLKHVVVQVEKRGMRFKEPALTTRIKIPGRYAVLTPNHQVMVSRRIRDWQKRSRLYQLGKELAPLKWGVLWRTASADQPHDVLKGEINSLAKEGEAIMERAEKAEAPTTLWAGNYYMDVEFPALSKKRLDDLRRSITPTIDGHHYYKACGERVSSALEMAEELLERGSTPGQVEELFKQAIEAEYPAEGSVIEIEHVKLNGRIFRLGKASVEAYDHHESTIRFSRVFEREGIYDGLETQKGPGDYAITEAKIGEWHLKTQYFSKDGRYKGTYINLNTPIELYPHGIRYVDLEVDVCIWPNGRVKALDEEKLEEAATKGLVTEKTVRAVREKLQEIMKSF